MSDWLKNPALLFDVPALRGAIAGLPWQPAERRVAVEGLLDGLDAADQVWALQRGETLPDAFTWAVAAGSAALITPGTGLCLPNDVQRLRPLVRLQPKP